MPRKLGGQDYTVVNGKDEHSNKSAGGAPLKEIAFMPSTLETIDRAFTKWIDETLNIFATTNEGWVKVPIIWTGSERAWQIKHNKDLRDDRGQIKLPIITVEKTSIAKDPSKPGEVVANVYPGRSPRGGTLTVARRIKQDKTNNFATADSAKKRGESGERKIGTTQLNFPRKNKKVVYETITTPLPVYVHIKYTVTLKAEYRQQFNEMLTPFLIHTGQITQFMIEYDGHQFESFMPSDFNLSNNFSDLGEDERSIENTIEFDVLGYLIGADKNQSSPKVVIRENAVEVRLPRERTIAEDVHPEEPKGRFYRE